MVANETNQKKSEERIVEIKTLVVEKNMAPIWRSVIAFIEPYKVNKDDVKIALMEAVKNVYMFAYPNTVGYIYISISIHDNKNLDIEVRDFGCGIEDVNKAKSPRFSTEETSGGMGFFLMEAFSNKMSIESTPKKGTVVTLSFEIF